MINLERPLTCFDLETTSPNPRDARIVQIAIVQLFPRQPEGEGTFGYTERKEWSSLINPEMPIPPDSTKIHGITDEMVKDAPTWGQVAPRVIKAFQNADFLGFNIARFDMEVIGAEFKRVGVSTETPAGTQKPRIVDPYVIWTKREKRTLSDALQYYCGRPLVGAHSALADVQAAIDVFEAQQSFHEGIPTDIQALHDFQFPRVENAIDGGARFVWDAAGVATINFGKHKGTALRSLDKGFMGWILKQDFTEEVKDIVRNAMKGQYPTREVSNG